MPETRASNKLVHPGELLAPKHHRTKDEVKAECAAKAQAKVDREKAKKQSIIRAAEFEHADKADKDIVDATPRPAFTPKPWPPPHNKKKANLIPVAKISDVEMSGVDDGSFVPPRSEKSVSVDDSAVESDNPPPAKRPKAQTAGKATAEVEIKATREAGKNKKVDKYDSEASDEETPKPKKVKVKVRDEINTMARKIEDETQGMPSKYGDIVKSMTSTARGKDRSDRKAASNTPSQAQVMHAYGRGLKREGAIADMRTMDQDTTNANPDLSTNRSDMAIDDGYILTYYSCIHC